MSTKLKPFKIEEFGFGEDVYLRSDLLALKQGHRDQLAELKLTLGMSIGDLSDAFSIDLAKGFLQAAREQNIELAVLDAKGNPSEQIKNVKTLTSLNIDGLMVVPLQANGLAISLRAANRAGVSTLFVDEAPAKGQPLACVKSDDDGSALHLLAHVMEALKGRESAKIVVLSGQYMPSSVRAVKEGLMSRLEMIGVELYDIPDLTDDAQVMRAADALNEKHPDLSAAICFASAAAPKLVEHLGPEVVFGFYDYEPDTNARIVAGISRQGHEFGRAAFNALVRHRLGEQIGSDIRVLTRKWVAQGVKQIEIPKHAALKLDS